MSGPAQVKSPFSRLPAEIRIHILEHVFADHDSRTGFTSRGESKTLVLDDDYRAFDRLSPLLVSRQWYRDAQLLAFHHTSFVITSLFCDIATELSSVLHPKQLQAIRSLAFLADARQFQRLVFWQGHAFGIPHLKLDTLTIVLHRSSSWHYLFDFTSDVAKLLRSLQGVRRFVFVRNDARVKGSFKTWYNRLVGLIMKMDHHERYEKVPPNPESVWWKWSLNEVEQTFCLEAQPAKPRMSEEDYMQMMAPHMTELMHSIESEEWNPDPRARLMYY